jgi:hypothetical protein
MVAMRKMRASYSRKAVALGSTLATVRGEKTFFNLGPFYGLAYRGLRGGQIRLGLSPN